MDFNEVFAGIKEKINSLYEKVLAFVEENKTISIVIGILLCLILVCLILLAVTAGGKNNVKQDAEPLVLTEELVNPDGPELPKDYNISRKTEKNWNESEIKEWFTVPTEKEVDALSKSNDNLVNEIIGAAP